MLTFLMLYAPRFHLDPSGTFIRYDAKAIGAASEGAQQSLQDVYHKVCLSLEILVCLVMRIAIYPSHV